MFVFLNDISMSPDGVTIADNWNLINDFIQLSIRLNDFGIERIKIHDDFANTPIADSHSLHYYTTLGGGNPKGQLVLGLLNNRVDRTTQIIDDALGEELENKGALAEVYLDGTNSKLLTGAYLTDLPSISFRTAELHQQHQLSAQYVLYYDDGKSPERDVNINNVFFHPDSIHFHHQYLVEIKKKYFFANTRWDPLANPIWNDQTQVLIEELQFPQNIHGRRDKKEELKEVGRLVAELNGWQFDEAVSKLNKSKNHMRVIFSALNGRQPAYLSVDFEGAYGRFELLDYKGRHEREIAFVDGHETGPANDSHNIKLRK